MMKKFFVFCLFFLIVVSSCWAEIPWRKERLDESRREVAHKICDFVISRVREGRYHPPMARHPEGVYYRATLAATLSLAGRILEEPHYIEVAGRLLDQVLEERSEEMWPMRMWAAFPIFDRPFPLDWKEQEAHPHPRTTGLVLYSLGIHHRISGQDRFMEPSRKGLEQMFSNWDFELEKENMLHFTAEAAALAAVGWQHAFPQFREKQKPIVDWVRETFVETAPKDFGYFAAFRMVLLLAATGSNHLQSVLRPGLDAFLDEPSWRYWHNQYDFRHTNDSEVNVRGNGALAYALRLHDLVLGKAHYTTTPLYRHLSQWMDRMRSPNGQCHSFQAISNGKSYAPGTMAHILQLWWILGGFLL